jgi:hypothetical protein
VSVVPSTCFAQCRYLDRVVLCSQQRVTIERNAFFHANSDLVIQHALKCHVVGGDGLNLQGGLEVLGSDEKYEMPAPSGVKFAELFWTSMTASPSPAPSHGRAPTAGYGRFGTK